MERTDSCACADSIWPECAVQWRPGLLLYHPRGPTASVATPTGT